MPARTCGVRHAGTSRTIRSTQSLKLFASGSWAKGANGSRMSRLGSGGEQGAEKNTSLPDVGLTRRSGACRPESCRTGRRSAGGDGTVRRSAKAGLPGLRAAALRSSSRPARGLGDGVGSWSGTIEPDGLLGCSSCLRLPALPPERPGACGDGTQRGRAEVSGEPEAKSVPGAAAPGIRRNVPANEAAAALAHLPTLVVPPGPDRLPNRIRPLVARGPTAAGK